MMLIEGIYQRKWLIDISYPNVLIAVNIKGLDPEEWEKNTRKPYSKLKLRLNLSRVINYLHKDNWYLTFTGITDKHGISKEERVENWCREYEVEWQRRYIIDLIEYEAMPYVDNQTWGST